MMELWPFTNFHDLNLDWLISKWKKLEENLDDIHDSMEAAAQSADDAHGQFIVATAQATRAKNYAENSADSAAESAASAASISGVVDQVNANTNRISTIVANAGDGTIPSELVDIRVAYNGITYPTAGDAVRGQVEALHDNQKYIQNVIGVSFIPTTGTAFVPSTAYQSTQVIGGISLEAGKTYDITMTLNNSIGVILYGYLEDTDSNTLRTLNILAGDTTATYSYTAPSDYNGVEITFKTNSTDTTLYVTATIEEHGMVDKIAELDDAVTPLTTLPITEYKEFAGYFNPSGQIAAQTADEEYYTNKIDLTNVSRVDFYQDVGENSPFNAYVLYDENNTVMGSRITWYTNGTRIITPEDTTGAKYIAFCYRTFGDYHPTIRVYKPIWNISADTESAFSNIPADAFRLKPYIDHLFVDRGGNAVTIPHESLYHVRLSKTLGFNMIEANVAKTSDNVFIVNHLNGGKFGSYFHHVDNTTDISDIEVSSVTWSWIEQNVRYNSIYPQYRTRPCTLQEFLGECKQQGLVPLATSSEPDAVEIIKNIMGVNNYIAYGGNRSTNPDAIITHWVTRTSKQDIIDYCENIGKPFLYGMANPTAFTDAELQDIIDTLHEMGYWIGASYADALWYKYLYMGFDTNATQKQVNRIPTGNICNYNSIANFNDFSYTNATEANGVLTFTANGTLTPDNLPSTNALYMFDLEIDCTGTLTIPPIGEWTEAVSYTTDGSRPLVVCVPIINDTPEITIQVNSGTVIKDIKYKLSKI